MAQVMKTRGTREEVWNGIARATSGGLVKDDLKKNARGALVSIKQSDAARARYPALKAKLCAAPPACACKGQPCVCQPNAVAQPAVVAAPAETAAQRAARIFAEDEATQRNRAAEADAALQRVARTALDRVNAVARALPTFREHKRKLSPLLSAVRDVAEVYFPRGGRIIARTLYELPAAIRGPFEEALAPLFEFAEVGYQPPAPPAPVAAPRAAAPVAAPAQPAVVAAPAETAAQRAARIFAEDEIAQRNREATAAAALQQMAQMALDRVLAIGRTLPRNIVRDHKRQISELILTVRQVVDGEREPQRIAGPLYEVPAAVRGQFEEALAPLFAYAEVGYQHPPPRAAAPAAPRAAAPAAAPAPAPEVAQHNRAEAAEVALQQMAQMAQRRVLAAGMAIPRDTIRKHNRQIIRFYNSLQDVANTYTPQGGRTIAELLYNLPAEIRGQYEEALAPLFAFAEIGYQRQPRAAP